jgi:hypothetical protein
MAAWFCAKGMAAPKGMAAAEGMAGGISSRGRYLRAARLGHTRLLQVQGRSYPVEEEG